MTHIKQSHQASLQTVYKKLDRDEPFTNEEKNSYSNKEQALIRGIQLKDKLSKDDAKEKYILYLNKSDKAVKGLSSSVRKYLKAQYPKVGHTVEHNVDEFVKLPQKTKIRKENKQNVNSFLIKNKSVETSKKYSKKSKKEKNYIRIKNGHKDYPNASLPELRHGPNSVWSQDWRLSHGLQRNYK
jgi:hypothetical protein